MEKIGVDAFVEGGFFKGDLYLDEGKKIYKEMQFKRYNMLTIAGALLTADFRKKNAKSNAMGIKGDMKGDGMQLGGTLVVSKGGEKLLLCHKQTNPGDHTNTEEVLKALGIGAAKETGAVAGEGGAAAAKAAEINDVACECDAEAEKKDDTPAQPEAAETAQIEANETAQAVAPETAQAEKPEAATPAEPEKKGDEPADTAPVEGVKEEGAKEEGGDGEVKGDAPKE